jgi:translation initiation factor 2 subunit 2
MSEKNLDYESFLDRGKEIIPDELESAERLEVPNVRGHLQGNKTIISNFFQICKVLNREPEQVLKFLLKEMATKADTKNNFIIFNNKLPSKKINEKIKKYTDLFVLCKECNKPETELIAEKNLVFLKCQACGAKYTIQYKI